MLENKTDYQVKVLDFGFAQFYDPKTGVKDIVGSPLYMAPEIIGKKTYDSSCDVWSIGIIAFILLTGRPPFKGKGKSVLFEQIVNGKPNFESIFEIIMFSGKFLKAFQ